MKPILIFNLQRGIDEFSKVPGFLYQITAGFSNYLRKLIFLLSLAKNSRIISINWHSRWSLCVSSKAYIIGIKGTNLREGVFNTLFLLFRSRWCFLLRESALFDMVSQQWQQIEFHLIITNQLFDMWPSFNQAVFLVITCLNALLTHYISIGLAFQGSA